jgi:NAD(P)-dependent dehydrogenase (short-subunit alcohol dehydrogenase family)
MFSIAPLQGVCDPAGFGPVTWSDIRSQSGCEPPSVAPFRFEATTVKGKVCVVTGATAGIGLATALGLAQKGAAVVLVGRDPERGADAGQRIYAQTRGASVEFLAADLSVQAEVRRLARELRERYSRLDVLVNNAGGFFHRRQESAEGIEMTWALNVLAPYLLTDLLLPALEAGAPARIINLTSFAQSLSGVRFDDPESRRWYFRLQAYAQSKRAVRLLTSELARRLVGTGVTANAADPGFVATGIISRNAGRQWNPIDRFLSLVARTPEEGAQVVLYLAASPEVQGISGRCFRVTDPVRASMASNDEGTSRRLWQICEAMTAETRPAPDVC